MSFQIQINSKTRNTLLFLVFVILFVIPLVGNFALNNVKASPEPQFWVYLITICAFILTLFVLLFLVIFTKDKENKINYH
jgi:hypothetical protein